MKNVLLGSLFIIAFLVSSQTSAPEFAASLPQTPAGFETSLSAPITSTATSMTLASVTTRGGTALSGYNCFTIDAGSAQAEYVCGTVSGTTVSSLTRGIDDVTGTTTNATLKFSHRRGASVQITDFPVIQIIRAQLNGEDTIPNLLTYATTVNIVPGSPTSTVATKYYVDNTAVAGASNADTSTKGIVEIATAAETAASTATGGTGALLALPASLATSTPTASCTTACIVAAVSGKIAQSFIDLTQAFSFTGDVTLSSATSTNFGLSNVLGWNSLYYTGPGTHNATSSLLSNNGSGTLSWNSLTTLGAGSFLAASTTDTTVADTTTETTYGGGTIGTIPANALSTNGAVLVNVNISDLSDAGGDDSITVRVKFGGTTVCSQQVNAGTASMAGQLSFLIYADASTSAQRCINGGTVADSAGGVVIAARADSTSSVNTTTAQAVTVTVQWSQNDGASAETVTLQSVSIILMGRQ